MPQGGFGNLIALPLQRAARKQDNTVFLDSAFVPWADQWAFLASVRKIGGRRLKRSSRTLNDEAAFSASVATTGRWRNRALDCTSVTSKRGPDRRGFASDVGTRPWQSDLHPKQGLHPGLRNRLLRLAAFQNPSSTKRRRCGFRRTASHASSRAPRISRITSDCRAAASMTFARRSPSLVFAWSFATNATAVV